MDQAQDITVRRVRASDADRIAEVVNRALAGPAAIGREVVIERLGAAGFLLAERGSDVVGLLGWQAENLVVQVSDFLIWPARQRIAVGRALLSRMEQAAGELQCEVALLFLPQPSSPGLLEFCRTLGYESRILSDLPKAWREAALEAHVGEDDLIMMKQLRADRVFRPL